MVFINPQEYGFPVWDSTELPRPQPYHDPDNLPDWILARREFGLEIIRANEKAAEAQAVENEHRHQAELEHRLEDFNRAIAERRSAANLSFRQRKERQIKESIVRKHSTFPAELMYKDLPMDQKKNLVAMSKLLCVRRPESPFTLVLDDLHQSSSNLIKEFIRRSRGTHVNTIFVSFEGRRPEHSPHVKFISAAGMAPKDILFSVNEFIDRKATQPNLVIIDSLHDLVENRDINMVPFIEELIRYNTTVIACYHMDVPDVAAAQHHYMPAPLALCRYMASTIITVKSLNAVLEVKKAKDRSLPAPASGLGEEAEGIIQALNANDPSGVVLDTEFRRKSGTSTHAKFYLRDATYRDYYPNGGKLREEFLVMLDSLPEYQAYRVVVDAEKDAAAAEPESSFNLGITDKQRNAREGVELPYFDAQKGEGGEGGRILYDMGKEDDFDEEEDEI